MRLRMMRLTAVMMMMVMGIMRMRKDQKGDDENADDKDDDDDDDVVVVMMTMMRMTTVFMMMMRMKKEHMISHDVNQSTSSAQPCSPASFFFGSSPKYDDAWTASMLNHDLFAQPHYAHTQLCKKQTLIGLELYLGLGRMKHNFNIHILDIEPFKLQSAMCEHGCSRS